MAEGTVSSEPVSEGQLHWYMGLQQRKNAFFGPRPDVGRNFTLLFPSLNAKIPFARCQGSQFRLVANASGLSGSWQGRAPFRRMAPEKAWPDPPMGSGRRSESGNSSRLSGELLAAPAPCVEGRGVDNDTINAGRLAAQQILGAGFEFRSPLLKSARAARRVTRQSIWQRPQGPRAKRPR